MSQLPISESAGALIHNIKNAKGTPTVDIERAEAAVGRSFPPEYREWLKYCNGGDLHNINIHLIGVSPQERSELERIRVQKHSPVDLGLPIACDMFGNWFILLDGEAMRCIAFVDGTGIEVSAVIASSLSRFLAMLHEANSLSDPDSLFREDFALRIDPDLKGITRYNKAWE